MRSARLLRRWVPPQPALWARPPAHCACPCSTLAGTEHTGPIRLNKRLAELGLCSRRESDSYIERGLVEVDGEVVSVLGTKVTREQRVALTATAEAQQRMKLTVILNKPIGFISSAPNTPRQRPASGLLTLVNYDRQRGRAQPSFWPFTGQAHGTASIGSDRRGHLPKGWARGLAPAGRLDMDSSGMLIFTQNGTLARALIGGNGAVEKEYHVTVARQQDQQPEHLHRGYDDRAVVTEAQLGLLCHGLKLDGRQLRPALVSILETQVEAPRVDEHIAPPVRRKPKRGRSRDRQYSKLRSSRNRPSRRCFSRLSTAGHGETRDGATMQPTAELRFVLREGRYRQIRRMCDAVGLTVLRLHRVRIGSLTLDNLSTGRWRFATDADIAQLTHGGCGKEAGDDDVRWEQY